MKTIKGKTYSSKWSAVNVNYVVCPHCKNIILMGKRKTIDMLKDWAKKLIT